jgi:tripartite-type tricarboxylate transporter receptor subunit TctC
MKLRSRRQVLHLAAGTVALPVVSRIARAQAYPTRPVRLVVAAAAGGSTDIVARLIGQYLSGKLGQQIIIENRPGGANNIGTEVVVRAPADGYTLLLANAVNTINATLFEKLNYNFIRDTAPVASIARAPSLMLVHPSVPAETVPDFIAYAKSNPGKINIGSGGNGTSMHVSAELFKLMTGINVAHVPYRGSGPMLTDLLGGQVQAAFEPLLTSVEYVRAGKLRALGITSASRWEGLANIPTVGDFIPGFESSGWYGIVVPKNTPAEIVEKLNTEINGILGDPKLAVRLAELGGTVFVSPPASFGKFIAEETEKWAKVIRAANIKPE